jgi:hypothetical protein
VSHKELVLGHQGGNLMNRGEWEETLRKASKELCKALNSFGSKETLRLLVEFSKDDLIVNELLTKYPFIVAIGDFLIGKPTVQVDPKTFQTLVGANPDIWINSEKNNPEKEHKICEKTPRRPKRTRNRKRNLTSTKRHQLQHKTPEPSIL